MLRVDRTYNLVVLGGGPAGLLASLAAASYGAKVAIVERTAFGGTCLNTGCIPSKALLRTARVYADMRDAERYGARVPQRTDARVDFAFAMERMRRIRARIAKQFTTVDLEAKGIDVHHGQGRFDGRDLLVVNGERLHFDKAVIATGSHPAIPLIPGLLETGFLTTDNLFDLTECPRDFLVLGGGPLGCELAQAFSRLGSHVTIVQDEPMFLRQEERDAALILAEALARDGIEIHLNTAVVATRRQANKKVAEVVTDDYRTDLVVDEMLVGVGRSPNVEDIGLDAAGVEYDETRGVALDHHLRTSNPRIYAVGDVWAEHEFAHIEGTSSRIVVENALLNKHIDIRSIAIPWCTYTDPEIAHIGMYVREAREKGVPIKTFTVPMHTVHRAIADSEEEGFVKIHVREGTDEILGATVVARHAGEMMNDVGLAMHLKTGLRALADVVHAYPTQAAAIKMAAEACKRSLENGDAIPAPHERQRQRPSARVRPARALARTKKLRKHG